MLLQIVAGSLAVGVFLFDCQNVLSWWGGRTLKPADRASDDYTIVVPVYGSPRYFAKRDHLRSFMARTLVVIDLGGKGMARFARELETEGWNVARVWTTHPSPPALVHAVLDQITTTYVVRMDADTQAPDTLPRFVAAMADDGADICSCKIRVHQPRRSVERFQDLEYQMAMLSRHFRPWLTSGACMVAKTVALKKILELHSMWLPGEDIETGRIAHSLRMRIRHLDMEVRTDAPDSWASLFRQRLLWWAGNFRHLIVNLDKNAVHMPAWSLYGVALVYLGVSFKWMALVSELDRPVYLLRGFVILLVIYALVTFLTNLQVRSWLMIVFPAYAFTQALLMATAGSFYYLRLSWKQGSMGRYRFGYRRAPKPARLPAPAPTS